MNKKSILGWLLLLTKLCFAVTQPCTETSAVCVDASPVKYFNGSPITLAQAGVSCWKYDKEYNCPLVDECKSYIDEGCIVDISKSTCEAQDATGNCKSWKKAGSCATGPKENNTMISCGNEMCKTAPDGSQSTCFKATSNNGNNVADFGSAMAALEMGNEMGSMKNCFDTITGKQCKPADPSNPSAGVDKNCECLFFQGKFITYKDSWLLWTATGTPAGNCAYGNQPTKCSNVADSLGSDGLKGGKLKAGASPMPERKIDTWSDKGQLNKSLTGNKDETGIHAGNQYVYSFSSSSKEFDKSGQNVSATNDDWAVKNQQNSNAELNASTNNATVIDKDSPNAAANITHWNSGGSETAQGNTAKMGGAMGLAQNATKLAGGIMDVGSAFGQTCSAVDQSKMVNVGKHHCLFDYGGVPGPETNQWVLYAYGDKERWSFQDCTDQVTLWGATSSCAAGISDEQVCKNNPVCLFDPGQCSSDFCYGQHRGGAGGQSCTGVTGGNDVIWKGNVNCCYSSTIAKIITKAAFEQHIGGRPSLNRIRDYVAIYKNLEVCSVEDLKNGQCNQSNDNLQTNNTFQAMCERGISMNEMSLIDFSKVDFTEFYAEANRGINTSNYDPNNLTNTNQNTRITNSVRQQQQKSTNLQGKNYFSY